MILTVISWFSFDWFPNASSLAVVKDVDNCDYTALHASSSSCYLACDIMTLADYRVWSCIRLVLVYRSQHSCSLLFNECQDMFFC